MRALPTNIHCTTHAYHPVSTAVYPTFKPASLRATLPHHVGVTSICRRVFVTHRIALQHVQQLEKELAHERALRAASLCELEATRRILHGLPLGITGDGTAEHLSACSLALPQLPPPTLGGLSGQAGGTSSTLSITCPVPSQSSSLTLMSPDSSQAASRVQLLYGLGTSYAAGLPTPGCVSPKELPSDSSQLTAFRSSSAYTGTDSSAASPRMPSHPHGPQVIPAASSLAQPEAFTFNASTAGALPTSFADMMRAMLQTPGKQAGLTQETGPPFRTGLTAPGAAFADMVQQLLASNAKKSALGASKSTEGGPPNNLLAAVLEQALLSSVRKVKGIALAGCEAGTNLADDYAEADSPPSQLQLMSATPAGCPTPRLVKGPGMQKQEAPSELHTCLVDSLAGLLETTTTKVPGTPLLSQDAVQHSMEAVLRQLFQGYATGTSTATPELAGQSHGSTTHNVDFTAAAAWRSHTNTPDPQQAVTPWKLPLPAPSARAHAAGARSLLSVLSHAEATGEPHSATPASRLSASGLGTSPLSVGAGVSSSSGGPAGALELLEAMERYLQEDYVCTKRKLLEVVEPPPPEKDEEDEEDKDCVQQASPIVEAGDARPGTGSEVWAVRQVGGDKQEYSTYTITPVQQQVHISIADVPVTLLSPALRTGGLPSGAGQAAAAGCMKGNEQAKPAKSAVTRTTPIRTPVASKVPLRTASEWAAGKTKGAQPEAATPPVKAGSQGLAAGHKMVRKVRDDRVR